MLNTKENLKQIEMDSIQQEPLFTELTPEAAAVVEGSGRFTDPIRFDESDKTRTFSVPPGGTISLFTNTRNIPGGARNPFFSAGIRNVRTNNTNFKSARVGSDTTRWTGVRGGRYQIVFRDDRDGITVAGRATVSHS
ncbi:MAG: hypothetical protein ACFCUV_08920 [Rivularia sp. (in: cyanobacteria)]